MSNLQDQFDKREPAGFDPEALWSRIERPKKKRRPGWLLFFGLFALTAATASWWVMQPVGTGSQPQEKASLSRQKNLEKDIAERSMSTETQKLEKGKAILQTSERGKLCQSGLSLSYPKSRDE
jgi:hypothetical protein